MILPILKAPNPILEKVALSIPVVTDEVVKLAADMRETMHNASGIGLAAPQVGHSLSLFVLESEDDDIPFTVFINPRITWKSVIKVSDSEGCLSLPGLYGPVRRPKEVRVKAQDLQGNTFEIRARGLLARSIQHEYDHLQGILFNAFVPKNKLSERVIPQYPMI